MAQTLLSLIRTESVNVEYCITDLTKDIRDMTEEEMEELDAEFNRIESEGSEELLRHVSHLDCSGKGLTELPPLPNCHSLNCNNNSLTTLPPLPKCGSLRCYRNELTTLPPLPECRYLECQDNLLTTLPPLP